MSNWEILPPSGGSQGPNGGPLQARPPKVLRPIPVIDMEESDNDSTSQVRKFLESILTLLWQYRKAVMGGVAILVLLYVVLKLVLGFFAMVGGVYQEVVGYGNSLNANFWQYMKYPLLIAVALLALLFAISRYKASSLGGGTENTGRTVMHGIYSMWRPARNAIIFCAVCFGLWIGVIRIVQEAEHYKQGHDLVRVIDSTRSTAPGERSAFFNGQTHFLQEVIKFWNHDPEIVASSTRRERWEGIDTVRFESRYQQYNPDGSVFRGVQNPRDIGMFQINLDQSAKEIAEAECNVEAVDCQFKVARLIWKHSKFKRWLAHNDVLKAPVVVHKVVAPVGEWGEIFIPPFDDSCFWEVDRKVEMMGEDGQVYEFLPDNVPFFATRTTTYRVPDEPAGLVTISCRQHK